MINKISVKPDTEASKILFFRDIDFTKLPDKRIILLYGANGSGKTTLLKNIEFGLFEHSNPYEPEESEEDDRIARMMRGMEKTRRGIEHDSHVALDLDAVPTMYYRYRNGTDNFSVKEPRSYAESFDPVYITYKWNANSLSEGQSIVYSVKSLLEGMLRSTKNRESFVTDDHHTILLLDEIDSGLSIDNLDAMLRIIKRVLKQGRNIQFIMSFNNPYVLTYFPDVISMYDGNVHRFSSTEDMLKDLFDHKKMLDKSRKKSNGEYRIFE